jgi:hypothetical protein
MEFSFFFSFLDSLGYDSCMPPSFVRVPLDVISLQFVSPKLLVYNSSYTQPVIYI